MAPALMGQEASAETFDNFFLVTCRFWPKTATVQKQARRYFRVARKFKKRVLLSSLIRRPLHLGYVFVHYMKESRLCQLRFLCKNFLKITICFDFTEKNGKNKHEKIF